MNIDTPHVTINLYVGTTGEENIMGAVQQIGQTADEIAANVSQIGTDLSAAVNRLDAGIQALRDQVAQGQLDNAEAERASSVLTQVRDDLVPIRDKIVDAGDNADNPVPPVEPPPPVDETGGGGNGGVETGTPLPGGGVAP